MNKKYLILTGSFWDGHNVAKNSIKNYLEERWEIVRVFDYADMFESKESTQRLYKFFAEDYPLLRKYYLKLLELHIWNVFAKKYFVNKYSQIVDNAINEFIPDYIISVFPVSQYFVWNYKEKYNYDFKFWVVITDATIPHPWYFEDKYIDKFFVVDKFSKKYLENKLPKRKDDIISTFFPLERKYFLDKSILKNDVIAILLTAFSYDFSIKLLRNLEKESFYKKVIIIKWRNDLVFWKLQNEFNHSKFEFSNFINIKDELKNIDIFISKPGWALVSECIAQDVYMIIPFFIYWQEEENIDFLERNDMWFFSKDVNRIVDFLKEWYKKTKLDNFKKVKNRDAVKNIIENLT